jgi:ribose-phosphate pyrophosphokinase
MGELFDLICLVKKLRGISRNQVIYLHLPYIPNARMDRVKHDSDVFTLKYFAEVINDLNFDKVYVGDPHSNVSMALINNVEEEGYILNDGIRMACYEINKKYNVNEDELLFFYPDEGSVKRYADLMKKEYAYGIKNRDWETGQIKSLDIVGSELVKDRYVLIVDDICSKGGTFYFAGSKLKELGAKKVFLYVTHCETTVLQGEMICTDYVDEIYTTNTICDVSHNKIHIINVI